MRKETIQIVSDNGQPGELGMVRGRKGTEARGMISDLIEVAFDGECHQSTSSAYADYCSGCVARLNPSRSDGDQIMQALRHVLPEWYRCEVSVQPERNLIVWACYANNLIATT